MRVNGLLLSIVVGCTPSPSPQAPTPVAAVEVPPPPPATTPPSPSEPAPRQPPPATTAPDPPSTTIAPPPERQPSAAEIQACAARGGKIEPVCMLGQLMCVVRFRDAGKECSDKAQCLGDCLFEGDDPPASNAVGRCQRTSDPCGCKAPIVKGRVLPALCAD